METKMIGSKIAKARKELHMSQAQLAQRVFMSPQAIGKWERGESMPDIITLSHLTEILGVDLNYFSGSITLTPTEVPPIGFPGEPSAVSASSNIVQLPPGKQQKKLSWDMSRGNWVDADFSGLKNLHEKFSSSNMQRCKFIGSDLSGLMLKSNNIDSCDFSGSDISNSHIQRSNLANNQFKDCSLKETEFSGSFIYACDLTNVDFTGMVVKSGGFERNTIVNAVWRRTAFIDTHIVDIVFDGTVEDCSFEHCSFKRVTFRDTTLLNTFFKNNSLKRIQFIDCRTDRITYEFLKSGKADLSGITLLTA